MLKKLAWTGSLSSFYTYFTKIAKTEFELKIDNQSFMSAFYD